MMSPSTALGFRILPYAVSTVRIRRLDGIHFSVWFHSVYTCVNSSKRIQLGTVFFCLRRPVSVSSVPSAIVPPSAQSLALDIESVTMFITADLF